eukprot:m.473292 g.473292  ORF g.473292 m.473292 type:complete len:63 (+) comp34143_c0_seq1:60-248(+)
MIRNTCIGAAAIALGAGTTAVAGLVAGSLLSGLAIGLCCGGALLLSPLDTCFCGLCDDQHLE